MISTHPNPFLLTALVHHPMSVQLVLMFSKFYRISPMDYNQITSFTLEASNTSERFLWFNFLFGFKNQNEK